MRPLVLAFVIAAVLGRPLAAVEPDGVVQGTVRDDSGAALPGVTTYLRAYLRASDDTRVAVTDAAGTYRLDAVPAGRAALRFSLLNFAVVSRDLAVGGGQTVRADAVMRLALSADVVVTGQASFRNVAEVDDPWGNLVGIAGAASQGAVTAAQLARRPVMRAGDVLESVPGLVVSQHSGEGKAK